METGLDRIAGEYENNRNLNDGFYRECNAHPQDVDAFLRRGDALHKQERRDEAIAVYDRAIAVHPDCGPLHYNRGNALLEMQRWDEAIAAYRQAVRLMPAFAEGYVPIATALQALRRPYEAMASCHRALAVDPGCAEAHWNLALALLQVGEFAMGWKEFEWRWKKRGYTSKQRTFPQPSWDGGPLAGRTILIHAEQAFGDTLQFARFLPVVAERGGTLIVECPAPLKGLISGIRNVSRVLAAGDELPHFDVHLPLMSLPGIFGTTVETLPNNVPYLAPDLERLAAWSARLGACDEFRVGIVWAGRKRPDPNRTCPLEHFIPLARTPGIKFYSLQMGEETDRDRAAGERLGLIDLTSEIGDFSDTAALAAQLDLVVSIDTGTAHLAGAMGKETWVILPYASDWRWMLDRDDSPWYPGMRLFRQERAGDWPGVIDRLGRALTDRVANFAANRHSPSSSAASAYSAGLAGLRNGDPDGAERSLFRAMTLDPRIPEVYNGLGIVAGERRRGRAAVSLFRKAISLDPGFADGHVNLGNALFGRDLLEESASEYRRALEITPGDIRALQNLGVSMQAMGRLSEATECFERALKVNPQYVTARWNMAALKLLGGDLKQGFEEFEARFAKNNPVPVLHGDKPLWDGRAFAGKTLLVHAEQGFGDTIQFVRYLPMAAERGGRIIFECQDEALAKILESLVKAEDLFVRGETLPSYDLQVPLLSLPRIFGTTESTIPAKTPYLCPSGEKVELWKDRLKEQQGFRVGIVWAGRAKPDPKRSASLALMSPLAAVPETIFYSLQVGEGADQLLNPPDGLVVRDYSRELTDFHETAALVSNLDLVITIDSAVAHLAGAMGKPVWLLLPYAPDWRWMLERTDCPWYPTMRLFRQAKPGDWPGVMADIASELRVTVKEHGDIFSPAEGVARAAGSRMALGLVEEGVEWGRKGDLARAEGYFRKALVFAPGFTPAVSGLATVFMKKGNHAGAAEMFREAHEADPGNPEIMRKYAEALSFKGDQEQAAVLYESLVDKQPDCPDTRLNYGVLLTYLKRYREAEKHFRKCVEDRPADVRAHNLLGIVMQKEDRLDEAAHYFKRAFELDPACLEARNNYGSVLNSMGRTELAAAEFRKALELGPSCQDIRWNLSLACLRMGDYPNGWRLYDARWGKTNPVERRKFDVPAWDGSDIPGETLLVYCEQGYGDTFQFIRLAEQTRSKCGLLLVECQTDAVKGIVERVRGVDEAVARGASLSAYDRQCSLLDLPGLLGLTVETIPAEVPYLFAGLDDADRWAKRLGVADFPRVGLVWAGRPEHEDDHHRSITFEHLRSLFDASGISFCSLQLGPAAAMLKTAGNPRITDLGEQLRSYEDSAAVIENLDLVISVDTSVAHLAGGMGKPVWLLLPFAADWRWMTGRDDSPWYPTMRLFRQGKPGDWPEVIGRVRSELCRLAATGAFS